jgi:hypothetical protein
MRERGEPRPRPLAPLTPLALQRQVPVWMALAVVWALAFGWLWTAEAIIAVLVLVAANPTQSIRRRVRHAASRRIRASDLSGPGHSSRITSSPPARTMLRSTRATMIASSSWAATGMKSGTRSIGSAR